MAGYTDTELFIGGPIDGQRKAVFPQLNFCVIPLQVDANGVGSADFQYAEYRREIISADGQLFSVWVEKSLTTLDSLKKLLDSYGTSR